MIANAVIEIVVLAVIAVVAFVIMKRQARNRFAKRRPLRIVPMQVFEDHLVNYEMAKMPARVPEDPCVTMLHIRACQVINHAADFFRDQTCADMELFIVRHNLEAKDVQLFSDYVRQSIGRQGVQFQLESVDSTSAWFTRA